LINAYLTDCARKKQKLVLTWEWCQRRNQ
jgi:hypothetical protein